MSNTAASFSLKIGSIGPSSKSVNDRSHADNELQDHGTDVGRQKDGQTPHAPGSRKNASRGSSGDAHAEGRSGRATRRSASDELILSALEALRPIMGTSRGVQAGRADGVGIVPVEPVDKDCVRALVAHMRSFSGQCDVSARRAHAGKASQSAQQHHESKDNFKMTSSGPSLLRPSRIFSGESVRNTSSGADDWEEEGAESEIRADSRHGGGGSAAALHEANTDPRGASTTPLRPSLRRADDQSVALQTQNSVLRNRKHALPSIGGLPDEGTLGTRLRILQSVSNQKCVPASSFYPEKHASGTTADALRLAFERGLRQPELDESSQEPTVLDAFESTVDHQASSPLVRSKSLALASGRRRSLGTSVSSAASSTTS